MSSIKSLRPKAGLLALALTLVVTPMLSACSGRDTDSAEKVAAAQAAATRAEQAAERAEKAASKAGASQPAAAEAEPAPEEDPQDKAVADQNDPPNPEPDHG